MYFQCSDCGHEFGFDESDHEGVRGNKRTLMTVTCPKCLSDNIVSCLTEGWAVITETGDSIAIGRGQLLSRLS